MKYVKIDIKKAIEAGYLDPGKNWEGEELLICEDGYAYIDDVSNLPIKGNWDFEQAVKDFPQNIIEI